MSPADETQHVRELLEDAVADVEPGYGLDTIRARTASQRPRRHWAWGAGGAVLATAATVAVIAGLANGPFEGGKDEPGAAKGPTTTSSAGPVGTVYFVGSTRGGLRLFFERHRAPTPAGALDAAVEAAVLGAADDPDYDSPWPDGTTMQRAQLADGVLSVDLRGDLADRPAGMTRPEAQIALQQLVYTAQAAAGRKVPVTFLLDGRRTSTLLGEPTAEPVQARSADETLASVAITSLLDGATVHSPFTVSGRAAAFEANVQWELKQGDKVVQSGFTTAGQCCTLSPYSFKVTAPPGEYTLVVHDEDASGGEGGLPAQDTKALVVE